MELSALTRWESIGKDLYARGKLGSEIERIKQFSKMLSAARRKHRQRHSGGAGTVQTATHSSPLSGIAESKAEGEGDDAAEGDEADDEQLTDVSPLPLLDAIEASESLSLDQQHQQLSDRQEEKIQDEIEAQELDSIPPTHLRVRADSTHTHSRQAQRACIVHT